MLKITVLLALVAFAAADVYLHNPPGSNNRIDDDNNADTRRLFDSQNNNAGGYNSGIESHGMNLKFYEGSILMVEWTAQNGCGFNKKSRCDTVLQYRCDEVMRNGEEEEMTDDPDTEDPAYDPPEEEGVQEPYYNWMTCKRRERNKGLFIADQNVGNQARHTRQNPGGARAGFECPEERDYYPYWHPSVWVDIAITTSNMSQCDLYAEESQNVKEKHYCTKYAHNNQESCENDGGAWEAEEPWSNSIDVESPECIEAMYSRDNVHSMVGDEGQGDTDNAHFQFAHYNWTIPEPRSGDFETACVLRLRYNVTSIDFANNVDSNFNDNNSPVKNDPRIDIGIGQELALDINTAQYGRTFQDRTHIFEIHERPGEVGDNVIFNLNVRGKRGNIVQVNPSTEYDYVPNRLHLQNGDYAHFQWTGSDNNPQGTDRNNVLQIRNPWVSYPTYIEDLIEDQATSDYYGLFEEGEDIFGLGTSGGAQDPNLQDVDAYYNHGVVEMQNTGTYFFMSSKNNEFTNRGHKATFIIEYDPVPLIIGLSVAALAVGAAGAGGIYYVKKNRSLTGWGKGGGAGPANFTALSTNSSVGSFSSVGSSQGPPSGSLNSF